MLPQGGILYTLFRSIPNDVPRLSRYYKNRLTQDVLLKEDDKGPLLSGGSAPWRLPSVWAV